MQPHRRRATDPKHARSVRSVPRGTFLHIGARPVAVATGEFDRTVVGSERGVFLFGAGDTYLH